MLQDLRIAYRAIFAFARTAQLPFQPTIHHPQFLAVLLVITIFSASSFAADLKESRQQLRSGQLEACIASSHEAIQKGFYGDSWPVLKANAEWTLGRYEAATITVSEGLERYPWSVRLKLIAHRCALFQNDPEAAQQHLADIDQLAARSPWRYSNVENLISLGEAALLLGADARTVLEAFFDRAKQQGPERVEPYLASGNLALQKHDHELAAEIYQAAVKKFPNNADIQFGLAQSVRRSHPEISIAAIQKIEELNPKHIDTRLFQIDSLIDSEQFQEAEELLGQVLEINDRHPTVWAYKTVIAHLQNDPKGETLYRAAALRDWPSNPEVDHLIGKKLSQHYRFTEGAAYQKQALAFNPKYLLAKIQLSQDLLRLGKDTKGWQLVEDAHESDGYDVVTFNLLELKDELSKFRTLEDKHFIVRMSALEAEVYGQQVLSLLNEARTVLCEKYELKIEDQITVEIFPNPSDFAVRTFGVPAVSGYLGVCFGKVITANSPASQGEYPANWKSVLWHEFCHVVTLEITKNKMPRWLSEGISVYEELQANPAWGQSMNGDYREMILGGELTPVSQLSSAFFLSKIFYAHSVRLF